MSKKLPWIKLGGKQEPPFNEKLAIFCENSDSEYWAEAYLQEIKETPVGKTYVFNKGEDEYTDATHYLLISKPQE